MKTIIKKNAFRFRRFCRRGYAAFNSLHRVVNIGQLASYIADKQLSKSAVSLTLVLATCNIAQAQSEDPIEEYSLPTLNITATVDTSRASADAVAVISRQELEGLTINSVGELLDQLPGIDLRTRGGGDVQGDLTLRGGTFDQMIVLLNGINLSDAQTGHHNLDIPIDLSMVDRVEIIPASALIHYGISAFGGAVNIVTCEDQKNLLMGILSGGSFGTANASLRGTRSIGDWTLSAAASYHRSDGYRENTDYNHGEFYLQANKHENDVDWLIQLGGQTKDFGSQAFYSLKYPDQFEATRTLVASITRQKTWHNWQFDISAYGRLHRDRFELFREGQTEAPSWYTGHNYHLSSLAGVTARASRSWLLGRTIFGGNYRYEGILSNVLGDSLDSPREIIAEEGKFYPLGANRSTTNLFAEHNVYLNKVHLSGSLLGSYNTMMGWNHGYSITAYYPINSRMKVDASFSRSFRLPTYNDRYYHSATQISNPDIESENSRNIEVNGHYKNKGMTASAGVYFRNGANIIDWIRTPESTVWYSKNHTEINALGSHVDAAIRINEFIPRIGISYSFCTMSKEASDYISNYALDYLKHKIGMNVVVSPISHLRVKLLADYHYREGAYTDLSGNMLDYEPVFLVNASAEYDLQHYSLFVEGFNLTNKEYFDYGGIPQAGLSLIGGIKFRY